VSDFHVRRLPHYTAVGQPVFLTWRLHGSLPVNRCFPAELTSGKAFVAMDRLLDTARCGPVYLQRPEIATMVADAIRYRDAKEYELHAYVVMPNHVHILITPRVDVSRLMQSLKRFTARQGNRMLGLTGQTFWQDESYDRLVRNQSEFDRIAAYIERNPVTAGLAGSPEEFAWSSAWPIANRPQVNNLPHKAACKDFLV
jgi:putative DNA methylase